MSTKSWKSWFTLKSQITASVTFLVLVVDIETTSVMASKGSSEYTDDATTKTATLDTTSTDSSQTLSTQQG